MTTQPLSAESNLEMRVSKKVPAKLGFSIPPGGTARRVITGTSVESLASRVTRHPLLAGMDQKHLALLIGSARALQFKKGDVICREGDPADRFFLFEPGAVITKSSAGLGDPLLAWVGISPPHAYSFTAYALKPTTVIFFKQTALREYCEKDHSLGYELLKRINLLAYQCGQAARNKMLAIRARMAPRASRRVLVVKKAN